MRYAYEVRRGATPPRRRRISPSGGADLTGRRRFTRQRPPHSRCPAPQPQRRSPPPAILTAVPANGPAVPDPHVIVLYGALGALARRKLLPGLFHLHRAGLMPAGYRIPG